MITFLPRSNENHLHNLLKSESPNFDISLENEGLAIGAGINIVENKYNFKNIIIGTLTFLIILVWFDYFQTVFYELTTGYIEDKHIPSRLILAFASFSTILSILIIVALIIF